MFSRIPQRIQSMKLRNCATKIISMEMKRYNQKGCKNNPFRHCDQKNGKNTGISVNCTRNKIDYIINTRTIGCAMTSVKIKREARPCGVVVQLYQGGK